MERKNTLKPRYNFSYFEKIILSTLLLGLVSTFNSAQAQFKKYQSKTSFQKPNNDSDEQSAKQILDDMEEDGFDISDSDSDDFGRKNQAGKSIKIDNKFVNLNPETAFGPEIVEKFDFEDTSLVELTKHMQKLTGINLILDKELKGKVSISASTAITVGDAWKAYLTALNINGYTLVKSGAFYKIVQSRDIRYTPTKIYTGDYTPNTENYVMRILPLENINSSEVTRSFRPFMSRYGRIIEIKQTNTIIVQDTGSNINRLVRLIKFIDVPGHEETLQIIPVKHSSAQEIAKLLDQILKSNSSSKKGKSSSSSDKNSISKIIAEPRTNSIIAMADASGAKQLKNLIAKLDIEGANQGGGQIHVYYLNHGDSETLAKTLSSLVSGNVAKGKKGRFTGKDGSGDSSLFNSEVKITADKENNAIVVTASSTDWLTIKSVVEKLDIPRDQVFVEGMIMETQINKGSGFGVSVVGVYGEGGVQKAGFTGGSGGQDLLNVLTNNITSLGGLFIGSGTGETREISLGGSSVTVNSVQGLITAIANHSNTNVLATPQILALDNTEASFEVGESVPVTEQTIANNQTQVTVKQQKAGLSLKITPQINKVTRFVKLKIDQKIEEFQARANSTAAGGLATTNRATVTTVVVRDKDTIAMGGLMRDQTIQSTSKVPLLGDIPLLGWLFKNRSKTISKVNLLFFLTPQIMDSYQKTIGKQVKTGLNRRAAHMKYSSIGEDPFGKTVKSLYEKASLQEKGPLYDKETQESFKAEQIIDVNLNNSKEDNSKSIDATSDDNALEDKKVEKELKEDFEDEEEFKSEFPEELEDKIEDDFNESKQVLNQNNKNDIFIKPDYKKIAQKLKSKSSGIKK